MKGKIYNFGSHTIDFSKFHPVFDGKSLCTRISWFHLTRWVLDYIGYTFEPFSRPVCPIMTNWNDLSHKFLRSWMIQVFDQISSIDWNILRILPLRVDGFSFKDSNDHYHKVVRLSLKSDDFNQDCCTTIDLSVSIIQRFLNSPYRNKMIIVN